MYKPVLVYIFFVFIFLVKGKSNLELKELINNAESILRPADGMLHEIENVTLNCKVISLDNENVVDKLVSWSKNNFLGTGIYKISNGNESHKFMLIHVMLDNKGRYVCTSMKDDGLKLKNITTQPNTVFYLSGSNEKINDVTDKLELVVSKVVDGIEKELVRPRVFVTTGEHFALTCKVKSSYYLVPNRNDTKWVREHGKLENGRNPYTVEFNPVVGDNRGLYTCISLKYNLSKLINVIVRRNKIEDLNVMQNNGMATYNIYNVTTLNLDHNDRDHFDETDRINLTNLIFAVPGTILVVLFFMKLFCYVKTKYSLNWERMNVPSSSSHPCQMCNHYHRRNPLLSRIRLTNQISCLIMQRVMATDNARNMDVTDLPPSYSDSTMNTDLPPPYSELISGYDNSCSNENGNQTNAENRSNSNMVE